MGGKFGFGWFSGQPILVPSAIHVLAQLGLRVHKDLTHFTLEVLAGNPDAAFAAQPLALAACTSCHHFPPASWQNTVTLQHQFVLCAAVMCLQLGDGVYCDFTNRTMEVSLALLGVFVVICTRLPICA